jgi:hypothetical protein
MRGLIPPILAGLIAVFMLPADPAQKAFSDALTEQEVRTFMTEDDGSATVREWKHRTAMLEKVSDGAQIALTIDGREVKITGAEAKRTAWVGYKDHMVVTIRTVVQSVAISGDRAQVSYASATTILDPVTQERGNIGERGILIIQKKGGRLTEIERKAQASRSPGGR